LKFFVYFSQLTEKECNLSGGIIHFMVMDHDLMWSNDFEGEAFLEISKVTGVNHENRAADELKPIELALTHPKGEKKRKILEFFYLKICFSYAKSYY
jgi:hypothetical protein